MLLDPAPGGDRDGHEAGREPAPLTELSESPPRRADEFEPWTETSIEGLPAIVYRQRGDAIECSISVQVTDQQMLTLEIVGKELPDNYWANDRCGGVAKMAEAVIDNLRHN